MFVQQLKKQNMTDSKLQTTSPKTYFKIVFAVLIFYVLYSIIERIILIPYWIRLSLSILTCVFILLPAIMILLFQKPQVVNKINESPAVKTKQTSETVKDDRKEIKENHKNEDITDENLANEIKHTFLCSENRITRELFGLKVRSNWNLAIGSTISIIALIVLGVFINSENFNDSDYLKVLVHFLPRLSLVLFIEIFALFCLRLYKLELLSMKYYHNELTNIESKKIATIISVRHCEKDKIWETVNCLLKVERNIVLRKKDTTLELETQKLENEHNKSVLGMLQDTLNKVIDKIPTK